MCATSSGHEQQGVRGSRLLRAIGAFGILDGQKRWGIQGKGPTGQPKGSWGGFRSCSPPHVIIFESTCSRAVWRILSRLCETEGSLRLSRITSMSLAARPAGLACIASGPVPPSDEELGRGLKIVPLLISSRKSFPSPPELEPSPGLDALSWATEEAGLLPPPPPLAGGIGEAASLSILIGLEFLPAIAVAGRLQMRWNSLVCLPGL
jgi:hypothetical protein